MIRRIGRSALQKLAAMVAAARRPLDDMVTVSGTEQALEKSLASGGVFVYRSLNPHGCPWPGRRAACARRTAGKTRRMR